MKQKAIRLIPLACFIVIGGIISLLFNVSYLVTILVLLVVPSIYLAFLTPKATKKTALFALAIIGIPLVIDGLLIVNDAWFVKSVFSYKLLGLIPIEDILFSFFSIYLVVLLYEYLWESYKTRNTWPSRMNFLGLISLLLIIVFVPLFLFFPQTLLIPYAYFWVLFATGFIPSVIMLFKYPQLIPKLFTMISFCFPFALFYEAIALRNKIWGFRGNEYIAIFSFVGFELPFEEFFFFLLSFPAGVLAYYTLFDEEKSVVKALD